MFYRVNKAAYLCIALAVLSVVGCSQKESVNTIIYGEVKMVPTAGDVPSYTLLSQNWDSPTRNTFWYLSQGSRFIPYAWFMWLEQKNSTVLFRHTDNMNYLRYIAQPSSAVNPAGLPIGFAKDKDKKTQVDWLGFTCAACHTAQVDANNKKFIIEGGPTMGNFNGFFIALIDALNATLEGGQANPKFDRFARKVLEGNYSPNNIAALYGAVNTFTQQLALRQQMNTAKGRFPKEHINYARLDAFGIIKNAVTAIALGDASNSNNVSAPVSYPFLWGTNQSDVVQWNGLLPNDNFLGPLARNAGEVVGAFGGLEINRAPWWKRWFLRQKNTYTATVQFENIGKLEAMLRDLRSPQLKEIFPQVANVDTTEGEIIYRKNCMGCHALVTRENQDKPYAAKMIRQSKVGTDDLMVKNAIDQIANTLQLEGVKKAIYIGDKFGPVEAAIEFPINGTFGLVLADPIAAYKGALLSKRKEIDSAALLSNKQLQDEAHVSDFLETKIQRYYQDMQEIACDSPRPTTSPDDEGRYCYKARPLTGIWATAPYLHNGSVPSLNELLKKPEDRVNAFWVGSRQIDIVNVGLVDNQGLVKYTVRNKNGDIIRGNDNKGHAFGTGLSNEKKQHLLDFLKTL